MLGVIEKQSHSLANSFNMAKENIGFLLGAENKNQKSRNSEKGILFPSNIFAPSREMSVKIFNHSKGGRENTPPMCIYLSPINL